MVEDVRGGDGQWVFQLEKAVFLGVGFGDAFFLRSTVLKPYLNERRRWHVSRGSAAYLHVGFGEIQRGGKLGALGDRQVLFITKFLL